MDLLSVDFSALRTLTFVHDLRSFSKAAEALGQTQSNVSYTIAKLRKAFGDDLFLRDGPGIVPTETCRAVVARAGPMLDELRELAAPRAFAPATANGLVTLSCTHYERVMLLPDLIRSLRAQAPGLRLRVLNAQLQGEEQLKRSECDILLGPVAMTGDQIYTRRLMEDGYVCVTGVGRRPPSSRDALAAANLALISYSASWQPPYVAALERHGLSVHPVVELRDFGDMAAYLDGSDLVSIVPGRMAARMGLPHAPLPVPVRLQVDMYWSARSHRAPLFQWVRDRIADAAARL